MRVVRRHPHYQTETIPSKYVKSPVSGISLSALSALTKHPNPQISWAAQTVIVDRVLSDPLILDAIRSDAMQIHDAEKRRRAERALGFLNEWDEMQVWAGYENDSAEVEVEAGGHHRNHREETPLTAREMREMMADLGRHRGGVTSLEEELGEEGHEGNVELMGVGNLVGLEGNVGAREERRARREAMVIEGRDDDGEAEDGEQRGWWVVR